jgi:hypothetical protein
MMRSTVDTQWTAINNYPTRTPPYRRGGGGDYVLPWHTTVSWVAACWNWRPYDGHPCTGKETGCRGTCRAPPHCVAGTSLCQHVRPASSQRRGVCPVATQLRATTSSPLIVTQNSVGPLWSLWILRDAGLSASSVEHVRITCQCYQNSHRRPHDRNSSPYFPSPITNLKI